MRNLAGLLSIIVSVYGQVSTAPDVNGGRLRPLKALSMSQAAEFSAPPKLSTSVIRAAQSDKVLRVFILLSESPQVEVMETVRNAHAKREVDLESRRLLAVEGKNRIAIENAQQDVDDLVVQTRREAIFEIKRRIRPQQERVLDWLKANGAVLRYEFDLLNLLSVEIPAHLLRGLEANEDVVQVDLVGEQQGQLEKSAAAIGAPTLWQSGFTGTGQSVLVLDSGINASHAAFTGRVRAEGFVQNNPTCSAAEKASPIDTNGHGTHVAGIISSAGTSLLPNLRGVAYGLGTLYAAKISCANGRSFTDSILAATIIAYAAFNISIVNNSNGSPTAEDDDLYSRELDRVIDIGQLIWINAAGNSGPAARTVNSPATGYNGISVANFDATGAAPFISSSSSVGPTIGGRKKPDIGAPGTDINSTSNIGSLFRALSGTSMAAPHIAGAAALLRQAGVRSPLAIKALLINTTDTAGWTPSGGYGFADVERAFNQRELIAQGTFASALDSVRLYKASVPANSTIYATLAWNRHITTNRVSMLRDLNLSLYDRPTGELTSISDSTIDNVEAIAAVNGNPSSRDVVVTVVAHGQSNGIQEPFALASSYQMQQINGWFFSANCQLPTNAPANSLISMACTVANQGDLEALEVIVTLSSGGTEINPATSFGAIYPGQSVTRTFSIRTGAPGSMPIRLSAFGNGFGVFRIDYFNFTLNISAAAQICSFTLSANSATLPATGGTASVNVATQTGCNWSPGSLPAWLTFASPSTFSGPGNLLISAQSNSSSAERSHSLIVSGQSFTVRQLAALPSTRPVIQAVTDAANSGITISAGSWISIFGTNLAKSTRTWGSSDFSGRFLPTRLDGTTVSINGRPAYISYISAIQVNALVPDDPQTGSVQIVVSTSDGQSAAFPTMKQPASPAFFALPSGIIRYAAATHPDGVLVAPIGLFQGATSRPARRGGTITLYATGCGPTAPSIPSGEVVASPATLVNAVRISADNISLPILYAGVVSSGLCQFNVTLPNSLPGGNTSLTLQVGSFRSVLSVVVPVL